MPTCGQNECQVRVSGRKGWTILLPFWLPFGSIGGSSLAPFSRLGGVSGMCRELVGVLARFWLPFCSMLGSIFASFFNVFFIDSIGPFPIGFSAPFGFIFGPIFPSKMLQNTMCFSTLFWNCFLVLFRSHQAFILELSPTRGCIFHIFTFPEKSSNMS